MLDAAQGLVRAERVAAALLEVRRAPVHAHGSDDVPGTLVAAIRSATGASLAGVARWSTAGPARRVRGVRRPDRRGAGGALALNPGPELGIVQGGLEGRPAVFVPPFDPADIPVAFAEALRITGRSRARRSWSGTACGASLVVATRDGDPSLVENGAELLRGFATITATAVGRTEAIAELERSHDALEAAVAERTFELTQVVEELSRANRAKTEFVERVARAAYAADLDPGLYPDLLLHGMEAALTAAQREDLRTIDAAGGRLLGLIDDLIEVSDIEAGRVELGIEPVALTPFLEERPRRSGPSRRTRSRPSSWTQGRRPRSSTRTRGASTVLRNLLSNAVRFTPPEGSIRIEASGEAVESGSTSSTRGSASSLADQERVFERFQRGAARRPGNRARPGARREYAASTAATSRSNRPRAPAAASAWCCPARPRRRPGASRELNDRRRLAARPHRR